MQETYSRKLQGIVDLSDEAIKMRMNPRERCLGGKKEEEGEFPKMTSSSPSRQWSSCFKNPRIVRVSRSFGGKDRHSKVCTVRGLRDRRIRLSVPTAIQLYDLQERLGLTQPSKVIDWLLDATKLEIDKLPPLPTIPLQFHHPAVPLMQPNHDPYVSEFLSPNLFKERDHDQRWTSTADVDQGSTSGEGFGGFVAQNLFPLNSTHFPTPYNNPNYFQFEPPNLSLSQFGGGFGFSNNHHHHHHHHQEQSNCSSSHQASTSQIYMSALTPHFQPYFATCVENEHFREIGHFINSPMKSFSLNASLHSSENETAAKDKDNET